MFKKTVIASFLLCLCVCLHTGCADDTNSQPMETVNDYIVGIDATIAEFTQFLEQQAVSLHPAIIDGTFDEVLGVEHEHGVSISDSYGTFSDFEIKSHESGYDTDNKIYLDVIVFEHKENATSFFWIAEYDENFALLRSYRSKITKELQMGTAPAITSTTKTAPIVNYDKPDEEYTFASTTIHTEPTILEEETEETEPETSETVESDESDESSENSTSDSTEVSDIESMPIDTVTTNAIGEGIDEIPVEVESTESTTEVIMEENNAR